MSLYNGPARGGNRGGKDQFNWDSVKNDKDREFYLGHSVKASTGRWQKGKDILWYTREKEEGAEAQLASELAAIKEREEDLMAELAAIMKRKEDLMAEVAPAMGLKPKSRPAAKPKLDEAEMADLMRKARGEGEEEPTMGEGAPADAADHMPGLGFSRDDTLVAAAGGDSHEVLAGTGVAAAPRAAQPGAGQQRRMTEGEMAKLAAAEAEATKRAKKAAKKAKELAKAIRKEESKAAKREKKEKAKEGKEGKRHTPQADSVAAAAVAVTAHGGSRHAQVGHGASGERDSGRGRSEHPNQHPNGNAPVSRDAEHGSSGGGRGELRSAHRSPERERRQDRDRRRHDSYDRRQRSLSPPPRRRSDSPGARSRKRPRHNISER